MEKLEEEKNVEMLKEADAGARAMNWLDNERNIEKLQTAKREALRKIDELKKVRKIEPRVLKEPMTR